MLRFMRGKKKKSKKASATPSTGEVPEVIPGEEQVNDNVILTSVRPKDPDGGVAPPVGQDEHQTAPPDDGAVGMRHESPKMSVIPEEEPKPEPATPGQEAAMLDTAIETVIAAEPQYMYPGGDSGDTDGGTSESAPSVEDQESVVTVIERGKLPEMTSEEEEEREQVTYATVNKMAAGQSSLRARAEQLHDRYTPDKLEQLGAAAAAAPAAQLHPEGFPEIAEDDLREEDAQQQQQQREEDYYIYVTDDTIHNGQQQKKSSPISVELACPTFDSPERQNSIRLQKHKQQPEIQPEVQGYHPETAVQAHPGYLRQASAPGYMEDREMMQLGAYEPQSDSEFIARRREEQFQRAQEIYANQQAAPAAAVYNIDRDDNMSSDQDYPSYSPYPEYDSDRSDYDNFRSYDRMRRRRYRDDPRMIVRRSPSGGFVERTHSMPTIRYDRRAPGGYPANHRRPPPPGGVHAYGRPPHERRRRHHRHHPNPEFDPSRDPHHPQYRGRPSRYSPDPYTHATSRRHPHSHHHAEPYTRNHTDQGMPVGSHRHHHHPVAPLQERHLGNTPHKPVNQNGELAQPTRESNSPSSSENGGAEGQGHGNQKRRGEQRVSFKDSNGTVIKGETTLDVDLETGSDAEIKALLAKKVKDDGDDAVSIGSATSDMSESELRPRRLLVRRSIAIWFAWFCMGFYTEVVGPNIPYLRERLNGTNNHVAIALGARGAGAAVGGALGGLLCEVAPSFVDLWISSSLILGALCTSAVPWSLHIVHLCLTLGLSGLSKGFLQVATVTLVFSLWSQRGAMYVIYFIFMAYAVGAAPCAQLALLFDAGVLEQLLLGGATNSTTSVSGGPQGSSPPGGGARSEAVYDGKSEDEILGGILDTIPRPMYPFDMAAVLTFLCGAIFLAFFGSSIRSVPGTSVAMAAKSKAAKTKSVEGSAGKSPKSSRCFTPGTCGFRGVLGVIVYFILPLGVVAVVGSYHHLYLTSMSAAPFSRPQALLLQTVFWAAIALGCLVTPITTRCLSPNGLTISCLTMSILSTALLAVYGEKYPVFVWIFTVLLGLFSGPLVPAGLTLCNICLSPVAMGVVMAFLLQALGDGGFGFTAGFLLANFRCEFILYTALGSVGLAFLLYLPIIPLLAAKSNQMKKAIKKQKKLANGKVPNGKAIG